jgi:hypothetical protein
MDIQTIAGRAQLPARKVRYVLDQRVLPGLRGRVQKHLAGRPRVFTAMEGYCIACAALLLEGGVRRKTVVEVMGRLANMPWPVGPAKAERLTSGQRAAARPRTAIEALYYWAGEPAAVSIGDGVNLRLQLGAVDTGWIEPRTLAPLSEDYQPRVLVRLNLGRLRDGFRSEGGE